MRKAPLAVGGHDAEDLIDEIIAGGHDMEVDGDDGDGNADV